MWILPWRILSLFVNSLKKLNKFQILPAIRQKGKPQNVCKKKTKLAKFSEKQIFLTLWYTHRIWLSMFSWTLVLRFSRLPYYQRFHSSFFHSFIIQHQYFMVQYIQSFSGMLEASFDWLTSFLAHLNCIYEWWYKEGIGIKSDSKSRNYFNKSKYQSPYTKIILLIHMKWNVFNLWKSLISILLYSINLR